jgi:flagellar M-ring protein FliF
MENEESHEQYKPDSAVVRSEQTAEQTAPAGAAGSGGVPGALSNQPPAGGTVAAAASPANGNANAPPGATTPAGPAGAAPGTAASSTAGAAESVSKQATRNFEIDRTLSYKHEPGGRIKRLTVAVLVDNPTKTAADGKTSAAPLSSTQVEDITKLVKNAVGFDESRGDSVSVVNEAFHTEQADMTAEVVPIWQRPMVQDIARLALGALVLLAIALGILRPMIRSLSTPTYAPALAGAGQSAPQVGGDAQGGGGNAEGGAPAPLAYEQQIVQAKTLVAQDPKRVAQVVKTWVSE